MKLNNIVENSILGFIITLLLTACVGQPSIPKISEEEVGKYEKSYMAEYELFKQQNANYQPSFKWIQPKNKKEQCKVYVSINPNDDKTVKSDYSLVWDGECKDGYASGLGREIENTMLLNLQQIGYYDGGKAVDYCVGFDPINNWEEAGECSYEINKPNHFVKTTINDKNNNLEISYEFGVALTVNAAGTSIFTSPFFDAVKYIKEYPNYAYLIMDFTKDVFDNRNYEFNIIEVKSRKFNGFGFAIFKNGSKGGGEMNNGSFVRQIELPQSYFKNADNILTEIKKEGDIALEAQRKALIIKEKYKNKICKDSVKVNFMDNEEYKDICNEDKKIAQLKIKIDAKLAQIEQQKQVKRQQQNDQRLIQAREAEAMAAQRRAAAAEEANNQAAWDSINQSLQNTNNNMQMQQLNNNLMMYNLSPKRHDVYIH